MYGSRSSTSTAVMPSRTFAAQTRSPTASSWAPSSGDRTISWAAVGSTREDLDRCWRHAPK